jgi:hypothetical protein
MEAIGNFFSSVRDKIQGVAQSTAQPIVDTALPASLSTTSGVESTLGTQPDTVNMAGGKRRSHRKTRRTGRKTRRTRR